MTDRLAKQLKLPLQQKALLLVSTFSGKKPQNLDIYVVKFGPIQRGPLPEKILELYL